MSAKDFSLIILVTALWGVNFSVIKLGLESLDPFTLAGIRFLLCAFPLVFFIKKPDVSMWYVALYGLTFGVGLWGLAYLGIYFGVSAGISSLVIQMSAFLTVAMGVAFFNEKVDLIKAVGFLVAFSGLFVILSLTDGSITLLGMFFVILGAIFWSFANVIIKKSKAKRVLSFLIWSSLFSPIPLFLLAYLVQGQNIFTDFVLNMDGKAIFSILFQVYPSTLFGYWIWNSCIDKYDMAKIAPLSLLIPIFGLLSSYLIFDEEMGSRKIIASSLIILGLVISTFSSRIKTSEWMRSVSSKVSNNASRSNLK